MLDLCPNFPQKLFSISLANAVNPGLFFDYVNTFLKMKQEASGWPEWCQSENDKWRYIRDYHEKKGIFMHYNNMSFVLLYICKTFGDDLRVSNGYLFGLIDIWIQGGYIDV
jgi:hypothetical protein